MTEIIAYLFDPDENPIFELFYNAFMDAGRGVGIGADTLYKFSVFAYVAFIVFSVWLFVKLISWVVHLLGIGGK